MIVKGFSNWLQTKWTEKKKRIEFNKTNFYVYVTSTTNNSIFSIVDMKGNVLAWRSCGIYFHGNERATEVAHSETTEGLTEIVYLLGIEKLAMLFKGPGVWHQTVFEKFVDFHKVILKDKVRKKTKKKSKKSILKPVDNKTSPVLTNFTKNLVWKSLKKRLSFFKNQLLKTKIKKGIKNRKKILKVGFKHSSKKNVLEKITKEAKVFEFKIIGFKDVTSIPFNGCRRWKFTLKNKRRKSKFKNQD